MKRTLATTVAAAIIALVLPVLVGPVLSAGAVAQTSGYAGKCTGADATTGTTVVVDFQQLDGNGGTPAATVTRCSPNPAPGTARTGIQAMQDAGITPVGTQRYGLAFVCRIQGRPSATEAIPVTGNPAYHEGCVNTPPPSAYWGYWYADGTGSTWTYGSQGASSHTVIPGGFEGWSFALNTTATTKPAPGVTPRNPALGASPSVTLAVADPDHTITLGQSTTLTWTSTNTGSRTASAAPRKGAGAWSGPLAASGTKSITPTKKGTFTYTITGVKSGVSAVATARLTVT
ncbi:MAG: hypothetical protein ABI083_03715 [Lapillicoccus sp.]